MKKTKFKIGDRAWKPNGYEFPCTIVSIFETCAGEIRLVGEMDHFGLLHIFNENQLEPTIIEDKSTFIVTDKEKSTIAWNKLLESYQKFKEKPSVIEGRSTYEGGFDSSTWLSTVD